MWLFIFSGLIVCATGPVRSSCPVDIKPSSAEVRFRDPLPAICKSTWNQTEGMGWESTNGGVGLMGGVTSLPLKIVSVTDWALQPKCFINYIISEEEHQCARALSVTVYKTPDNVTLSDLGPLVEGDKYRMQCDIVNVAPVKILRVLWHKGNKIFHADTTNNNTLTPVSVSFAVDLTAHRDDNGAHIWCEAKLDLRKTSSNTAMQSVQKEVIVRYPPVFDDSADKVVELEADRETTLNCSASGNPAPQYRWHFPYSTELSSMHQNWHQPILTPSVEHPGIYNCTAFNAYGSKTKIFTVNAPPRGRTVLFALIGGFVALAVLLFIGGYFFVTSDGRFSFRSVAGEGCSLILKPSRVVVGFGESVSVSCEATRPVRVLGWESAISAVHTQQDLSVQWKADSLIDWIEEPICYGVFFTAPRQCEEKLNLVLYKTPDSISIKPVNHTGPMVEGKEYQLLCEVQNIAPVQYLTLRWYRGQTEVYNHSFADLTSSSPVQVSSILVITPSKAENGAQYRCVAVLELGAEGPQPPPTMTSEPLNASVYFPPVFLNPEPEVLDLKAGAEITLNCTATGNPAPVYSWQSSSPIQERMEDEPVLTSSSLVPGTYTCTASNALEKKSKQFTVKAQRKGV
ncbi:uncharacterized protein V6R79_017881 [Siganus canaliculatus]